MKVRVANDEDCNVDGFMSVIVNNNHTLLVSNIDGWKMG